jgi:hypothetical protein
VLALLIGWAIGRSNPDSAAGDAPETSTDRVIQRRPRRSIPIDGRLDR